MLAQGVRKYEVLCPAPASSAAPSQGDVVTIKYVGRLCDGRVFDESSREGSETVSFTLGDQIVTPGRSLTWLHASMWPARKSSIPPFA